ncbi:MAG TPA: hypothetical protein PLW77_01485 [Bacteroidales bacterium]|nr:hypothetical protein [Bacteroidales bacterium]HQB22413.1 hypothetical protein [Bacteroidales bacterium]
MEKIFNVKEKLNKILSFIDSINKGGISELEKEILLQKLKDVYFELSLIEVNKIEELKDSDKDEKPVEKIIKPEVISEKVEEKPIINKEPEKPIVEEKAVVETKKDSFVPIDFFELDEEEKSDNKEVVIEKKEEVKKAQSVAQGSLFPSDNNLNASKPIGEQLGQNKTSLNEMLASQTSVQDLNARIKPVSDIRSAMGLGDRFLFVRELFDGNTDLFDETITNLNSLNSFDEAHNYVKSHFQWNMVDTNVENFMNIVRRRYV